MNTQISKWGDVSRETLRRRQGLKLHRFLRDQVLPFSAYYRALFHAEGLGAGDLQSLEDLAKVPFTTKQDLLNTPENPQRVRDFLLTPDREVLARRLSTKWQAVTRGKSWVQRRLEQEYRPIFMTSTTGRSAEPIPFLFTRYDLDILERAGTMLCEIFNTRSDYRIVNMFPYAPHLGFWQVHYAMKGFGVFGLSTGGGKTMGTEGNIKIMAKINPDVIVGMPTFVYHLLQEAREGGVRLAKLHYVVLGGEKIPHGMRKKLVELVEQVGGREATILPTYGLTEARMAFGECPAPVDDPSGYHIYPEYVHVEIVDPETGEIKPDGEPGEIVVTPLDGRGTVVLRYRTGDFIEGGLTYEPCPHCGCRLPRLVGNIGRQSEVREVRIDKVKGTLVDFNLLEHLLDDEPSVGAWQLELRKVNDDPLEMDEILLHVQKVGEVSEADLAESITNDFAAKTEMRPNQVLFHNRREMGKMQGVGSELKERRLVDNRPKAKGNGHE